MVLVEASFRNKLKTLRIGTTGPIRIAYHNKVIVKDKRKGNNKGGKRSSVVNNPGYPESAVIKNDLTEEVVHKLFTTRAPCRGPLVLPGRWLSRGERFLPRGLTSWRNLGYNYALLAPAPQTERPTWGFSLQLLAVAAHGKQIRAPVRPGVLSSLRLCTYL